MLSVLSYSRLVARAVLGGLSQTDGRDYSLITASCGFGKDFRKGILKKGMCYGDDACFIARNKSADVLGKIIFCVPIAILLVSNTQLNYTFKLTTVPLKKLKRSCMTFTSVSTCRPLMKTQQPPPIVQPWFNLYDLNFTVIFPVQYLPFYT